MSIVHYWQRRRFALQCAVLAKPAEDVVCYHAWRLSRVGTDGERYELPTAGWKTCELKKRMLPHDIITEASTLIDKAVTCPDCIAACGGVVDKKFRKDP